MEMQPHVEAGDSRTDHDHHHRADSDNKQASKEEDVDHVAEGTWTNKHMEGLREANHESQEKSREKSSPHGNQMHGGDASHDQAFQGIDKTHGKSAHAAEDGSRVELASEENHTHHDEHDAQEHGERSKSTQGKSTQDIEDVDSLRELEEMPTTQESPAHAEWGTKPEEKPAMQEGQSFVERKEEKDVPQVVGGGMSMNMEDEVDSRRAFSDDNSSRDRVHFSRGSTPDVETPTQHLRVKPSKPGTKGSGNVDRGPGSMDGNPETPSTSWAFSARASIAPSKFDHMATLRTLYATYKESNNGREGVPLSLVYEMMKEIDDHRRKSAKEGNYLAADAAAQRLLELKLFEDNKRRAIMLERHAQEREQAEKAYKGELQERNQDF